MKSAKNGLYYVTGGASGLGLATAALIIKEGGFAVLMDMNEEEGQKAQSQLGPNALFQKCNVTSETEVEAAIQAGKSKFGSENVKIRGLINCAGVGSAAVTASPKGPHSLELFRTVMEINALGSFNCARLIAFEMIKQKPDEEGERGVIINTASVAAYEGQVGQVAYSSSKAAVVGMTIVMARELSRYGIRVMTIAPGLFKTPMLLRLPEDKLRSLGKQVPFPARLGEPEEYANLALSIITNPVLNGETIRLDGAIRMSSL